MPDIKFYCRHCTQSIEAPGEMLGQLIDCPSCGASIEVRPPPKSPPPTMSAAQVSPQENPPAPGREVTEYESHPAMFRNKPFFFSLVVSFPLIVGIFIAVGSGPTMGFSGFITMFLLFSGPILLIWRLSTLCSTLTITNKRSIYRRGLLSKRTTEVRHRDIHNLQVSQGLLQRIFDTGTLGISSSGQSGIEIEACGMPDPNKVKAILDKFRPE